MNFEKGASPEVDEIYEQEFSWDNSLENIDEAQELVENKLKELGWRRTRSAPSHLRVRETMMNAIVHGI